MLAHEAVEFLAVLGLPEVGHVLVERVDLFIEPATLLFEATQLLGAVLVERGVAARVPITAMPMPAAAKPKCQLKCSPRRLQTIGPAAAPIFMPM